MQGWLGNSNPRGRTGNFSEMETGLWIIAGPNGAGKTTLAQSGALAPFIAAAQTINPDQMTLALLLERGFATWAEAPLDEKIKAFREAVRQSVQSRRASPQGTRQS